MTKSTSSAFVVPPNFEVVRFMVIIALPQTSRLRDPNPRPISSIPFSHSGAYEIQAKKFARNGTMTMSMISRIGRPTLRAFVVAHKQQKSYQQQHCALMSIGRMLDMGGMPSAANDQTLVRAKDISKNNKLQAVAFDFEILTRSIEAAAQKGEIAAAEEAKKASNRDSSKLPSASSVKPDLDQIRQVASLLNVPLPSIPGTGKEESSAPQKKTFPKSTSPGHDVRAKYAAKLKGGLAGIELAKSKVDDSSKGGDAAGHLTVRKMAIKETAASPTKWMALTGTGKLLSYLTHRSIRIALLPNPRLDDPGRQSTELKYMTDFSKQLKEIVIDTVVPFDNASSIETKLRKGVLEELDIHPNKILVVSDKDEYLKAARDLGMITCRLRPKNAKRGNVTAHYTSPDVPSVQEVVNEITGISFNAVLNR